MNFQGKKVTKIFTSCCGNYENKKNRPHLRTVLKCFVKEIIL